MGSKIGTFRTVNFKPGKEVMKMLQVTSIPRAANSLAGANIVRAISDERRTYSELTVDYDVDQIKRGNNTLHFSATLPVIFQLHVNELPELYVSPSKAAHNELRRIIDIMAEHRLIEVEIETRAADNWAIRLVCFDKKRGTLDLEIDLPRGGAFRLQALETCRSFIVGRSEDDRNFLTDNMLDAIENYGFAPF